MNSYVKVSVIVPVYNVEKYLSRCILSLINQTLTDIEIILIDDESIDKSGLICDDYAKKDSRIKVLHIKNGGPGRARNFGIDMAEGEYIGFVDSDDYADKKMFEKLYNTAKENNSDIVMCGYKNVISDNITSQILDYKSVYEGKESIKKNLIGIYYNKDKAGIHCIWNKIFRKKLIQENSIRINEKLKRAEDSWLVFDALKVAEKVNFINDSLYFYVKNENSIMHTVQCKQYEQWVYTRKRLLEENKYLNFVIDYNLFYENFLYNVATYVLGLVKEGKIEEAKMILNDKFYKNVAVYTENLPFHIRLLHNLGRQNPGVVILVYKLWSKVNKC